MDRRRLLAIAAPALAFGLLLAIQVRYFDRGLVPGDAFVYLAAGERLNAGHDLYALQPGDRPADIKPPYWTVPFVSPPPMAVVWRPLAALPKELGVYLWWAAQVAALLASILMLIRRRPVLTSLAVIALGFPLAYEIGVGNVNSFLLLGLIAAWRLSLHERDAPAGVIGAAMTAVKMTPAVIGWWLLVRRRWAGFGAFAVAGLGFLAVSLLGAGLDAHLRYLSVLRDGSIGTSPLSIGGMASYLGAPEPLAAALPTVAAVIGLVLVWVLRSRADLSFVAAVLTMIAGSPAVSINWYILLLACLAPVAWPASARQAGETPRTIAAVPSRTNTQPSASA